jgi:hypothetical protein
VRIGTWNLDGKWAPGHLALLVAADCDVWLLTEVNLRVEIEGYSRHCTTELMGDEKWWAGIYSRRPLSPLPDPHVASAAARIDGTTYCSSILPWRSCGGEPTWPGPDHAGKTAFAVDTLLGRLPTNRLVWGGDWNHALSGVEWAGSKPGRQHVLHAVEMLGLTVPTAELPHRIDGLLSIDHIAVAADQPVIPAERRSAIGLSDHDCYVIQLEPEPGKQA